MAKSKLTNVDDMPFTDEVKEQIKALGITNAVWPPLREFSSTDPVGYFRKFIQPDPGDTDTSPVRMPTQDEDEPDFKRVREQRPRKGPTTDIEQASQPDPDDELERRARRKPTERRG